MTQLLDIEYQDKNGEWQTIADVVFESEPTWENDSFSYAGTHCTGGVGGTVHLPSYAIMEDYPTWDKGLYSFEQNWLIAIWLMANYSWVEDLFIREFENQSNDYEPDYE